MLIKPSSIVHKLAASGKYITSSLLFLVLTPLQAAPLESHVESLDELQYGVVLYDYFQQDYFSALVEHEYALASRSRLANTPFNQVLKGGMMLSYGMPDKSEILFNTLLNDVVENDVSNRAWYYLAKIYYNKSEIINADKALSKIKGNIPQEIFFDYYYLKTLVSSNQGLSALNTKTKDELAAYLPGYPYLLFNLAVEQLNSGNNKQAINYLTQVTNYSQTSEELSVLADRAKNGLAQISLNSGDLENAWEHLSQIRTSGLYSNRALLAYAWSAIGMKQYQDAVPALKILTQRSIAIPEVQEAIILLSHLYEQQGAPRLALQSHIAAESTFEKGMARIVSARNTINSLDVPREFIENIEAIVSQSGWYNSSPEIDYENLTPFLLDLMASNTFNEVLKELADLYSIRDNLKYWLDRSDQHEIILENAAQKNYGQQLQAFIKRSEELRERLSQQKAELKLYALALDEKDQERMTALQEITAKELGLLESRVENLITIKSAYKQPDSFKTMVSDHHRRLLEQLKKTESYIQSLEPIMRKLVNLELDKHEERMHYYWAQSRLAKTRLYDTNLLSKESVAATADTTKEITLAQEQEPQE